MKNQKNGSSSPKMCPRAKLPITDPPKIWVWFSECQQKWKIGIGHYEKLEKRALAPPKCILEQNSQLPTPLKFPSFLSVNGNGKLVSAIMKNWKNGSSSQKCVLEQNSQLPPSPKVWVSSCPSVNGNKKMALVIMKNWKNGSSSPKTCPRAKLPTTPLP